MLFPALTAVRWPALHRKTHSLSSAESAWAGEEAGRTAGVGPEWGGEEKGRETLKEEREHPDLGRQRAVFPEERRAVGTEIRERTGQGQDMQRHIDSEHPRGKRKGKRRDGHQGRFLRGGFV